MKLLERVDLSLFVPELSSSASKNRAGLVLLAALNAAAYARALFSNEWTSFILLSMLLVASISCYIFYRLSTWLHDKALRDPSKPPAYREIANSIIANILAVYNMKALENINLLLEVMPLRHRSTLSPP